MFWLRKSGEISGVGKQLLVPQEGLYMLVLLSLGLVHVN
jgi:hypothetical protein